jgi:threonine dehydratase
MPNNVSLTPGEIERASERLEEHVRWTPVRSSDYAEHRWDREVYLKLETLQRSGSFKIRGATNAILEHRETALDKGVIAASAGNHAQGVAWGAKLVGCSAEIVMPRGTPDNKVTATEELGAEVVLEGETYEDAYREARRRGEQSGKRMIHPFDDPDVIAGQGTVGREIHEQCPDLEWMIVPVGGGGLLAGISLWMEHVSPDTRLYPVQCDSSSSLAAALEAGEPVDVESPVTIAEGIATGRVGDLTFSILRDRVEEPLLVNDEEIVSAIQTLIEREKVVGEGAGAAGLAALERYEDRLPEGPGCIPICGGNLDVLETIHFLERSLRIDGRLLRIATELTDEPGSLSRLSAIIGESGGNIQFIHHDRSDLGVAARRAKVHIEVSVRSREHGESMLEKLREAGYGVEVLEI